jgi:hypothetical protein
MTAFQIPTKPTPESFDVSLSGVNYKFVTRFNFVANVWMIDIFNANTNLPIVTSLPVVTGVNILGQFEYLGFVGALYALTAGDEFAPPTFDNFGSDGVLVYQT